MRPHGPAVRHEVLRRSIEDDCVCARHLRPGEALAGNQRSMIAYSLPDLDMTVEMKVTRSAGHMRKDFLDASSVVHCYSSR